MLSLRTNSGSIGVADRNGIKVLLLFSKRVIAEVFIKERKEKEVLPVELEDKLALFHVLDTCRFGSQLNLWIDPPASLEVDRGIRGVNMDFILDSQQTMALAELLYEMDSTHLREVVELFRFRNRAVVERVRVETKWDIISSESEEKEDSLERVLSIPNGVCQVTKILPPGSIEQPLTVVTEKVFSDSIKSKPLTVESWQPFTWKGIPSVLWMYMYDATRITGTLIRAITGDPRDKTDDYRRRLGYLGIISKQRINPTRLLEALGSKRDQLRYEEIAKRREEVARNISKETWQFLQGLEPADRIQALDLVQAGVSTSETVAKDLMGELEFIQVIVVEAGYSKRFVVNQSIINSWLERLLPYQNIISTKGANITTKEEEDSLFSLFNLADVIPSLSRQEVRALRNGLAEELEDQ